MVCLCGIRSVCCGCLRRLLPTRKQDLDRDTWRTNWEKNAGSIGIILTIVIFGLSIAATFHSVYFNSLDPIFNRLVHFHTDPDHISNRNGGLGEGVLSVLNVGILLFIIVCWASFKMFGIVLTTIATGLAVFSIFNCFEVGRKTLLDITLPWGTQFMDHMKSDEKLQQKINVSIGLGGSDKSSVEKDLEAPAQEDESDPDDSDSEMRKGK